METKRGCPWCNGEMKKLYHHGEYAWSDDFSFDQKEKVRLFVCADCGRVKAIPVWRVNDAE